MKPSPFTLPVLLSIALTALSTNAVADTVFKCRNQQGALVYQDSPCEQATVTQWNTNAYVPPPAKPEADAYYVSAKKGRVGVYRLDGEINGVAVNMLIDTGASFLSIPSQMAEQLKLKKGSAHNLMSSNGVVQGYETTVKSLKIGRMIISNVSAVISLNTGGILLGQSVLGSLKVVQTKDELRLFAPQ